MPALTPFQTVGPFFHFGLVVAGGEIVADETVPGRRVVVEGTVFDGAREPVPDAMVEIWQADSSGRYPQGADAPGAAASSFRGFGRCATDDRGRFSFTTVVPGRVAGPSGLQAPHLVTGVLARGILTRLVTRIYFEGEPANGEDAVLQLVAADRRQTLIARLVERDRYRFDIVLQGEGETVFFDV